MTKESVLKEISEVGVFGLKVMGLIFVAVGILINVFLGLIIVAKLYGSEIALPITRVIQIIFNGIFYITAALIVIIFATGILFSLIKYNEKFREKKEKEFEDLMQKILREEK